MHENYVLFNRFVLVGNTLISIGQKEFSKTFTEIAAICKHFMQTSSLRALCERLLKQENQMNKKSLPFPMKRQRDGSIRISVNEGTRIASIGQARFSEFNEYTAQ